MAKEKKLTNKQTNLIRELFEQFDVNHDLVVSVEELEKGLRCINGTNPTRKEIKDLRKEFGIKKGEKINFEKFSQCLERYVQTDYKDKEAERKSLMASFEVFDRNKNGSIEKDELKAALIKLGEKDFDIDRLFKGADINRDGKIEYQEFIDMFLKDMN